MNRALTNRKVATEVPVSLRQRAPLVRRRELEEKLSVL